MPNFPLTKKLIVFGNLLREANYDMSVVSVLHPWQTLGCYS